MRYHGGSDLHNDNINLYFRMKDQTYWAVFTPEGEFYLYTADSDKQECIDTFMLLTSASWEQCVQQGYTVSKISISKIEE
jgi:hypothetical protein